MDPHKELLGKLWLLKENLNRTLRDFEEYLKINKALLNIHLLF